jgi:2-polyprenyl-3-methyl-5-hydroxy-6-metoxy-1,4-benzoquinol methylase
MNLDIKNINKQLLSYYNNNIFYLNKLNQRERKEYRLIISILDSINNKNISILDAGSGTGNLIKILHKKGYNNLLGIDFCKKFINFFGNKNILKLNNILNFNTKKKFDIILLIDVLEHTSNPKKIINNLKKHLKKDGILIIQAPNLLFSKKRINYLINLIKYYLNLKITFFIKQPLITKYKNYADDSDACYFSSPFEIINYLKKIKLKINFMTTYYNPHKKIKFFNKLIYILFNKIPILKFLGGSIIIITAKSNTQNLSKRYNSKWKLNI